MAKCNLINDACKTEAFSFLHLIPGLFQAVCELQKATMSTNNNPKGGDRKKATTLRIAMF